MPTSHTDQVPAVAVSPDSEWIATGSGDHTIILWDANGRRLRRLRGHRNLVQGLAFDSSGQRLLSTSDDNDLRLWDLASGIILRVFQGHTAGPWSVIVHDGRAYTAANDDTVRRWRLDRAGQWIWDLDQDPASALLLPDPAGSRSGDLLIGFADGAIRGYKLPPVMAGHSDSGQAVARPVAATDAQDAPVAPSPNTAGDLRLDLPGAHDNWMLRFAVTPDGQMLATAGMDHTARIWHIRRTTDGLLLEPLRHFKQYSDIVHAVNFSSDGQLLVTAGYDGQVGLFDLKTGDGQLSPAAEFGEIGAVEFTPDDNALVTAHLQERRLRYWQRDGLQLTNGRTIAELFDWPLWASLSLDGRHIAVVGRGASKVALYALDPTAGDTDTVSEPWQLVGHEQSVFRAIFDSDGRRLATVSADKTLRVWDLGPDAAPMATTGQVLFTLRLPELPQNPGPWDFDFRCDRDRAGCWIAVPLTVGRIALYRFPYARPPPDLRP